MTSPSGPDTPSARLSRLARSLGLAFGLAVGTLAAPPCGDLDGVFSELAYRPPDEQADSPRLLGTFLNVLNTLENWVGPGLPDCVVHTRELSYLARKPRYDALGKPLADDQVRLSGRVFFPAWRASSLGPLPIVVYTHGTNLRRDAVASGFRGHEWMFAAAAAAAYGLAVAMPDLPGMGEDHSMFHPFCHKRSLACAVVDALPAVRDLFQEDPYLKDNQYRWDGRIFLMGYSEGGYASLAAARELETSAGQTWNLSGTVSMGAPYDLSDTTRKAFLAVDTPCPHVFFVPFIVLGYQAVYGAIVDPLEILHPALLEPGEDGNVLQWADGSREGLLVDSAVARRLGVPTDRLVLRELFNPAWIANVLEHPTYPRNAIGAILQENDLLDGWAPTRPILFAHSPDDRDLPIQGTTAALEKLPEAVRRDGRDPAGLLELSLLGGPGEGVDHVRGLFRGIARGFRWIDEQRGR